MQEKTTSETPECALEIDLTNFIFFYVIILLLTVLLIYLGNVYSLQSLLLLGYLLLFSEILALIPITARVFVHKTFVDEFKRRQLEEYIKELEEKRLKKKKQSQNRLENKTYE